MKKSFFYAGILAAGLMTVSTSCSKDDKIIDNGGIETPVAGAQELVLMAANGGDGLKTKAGRPMYSSEAKQNIDYVTIKFIDKKSGTISEVVTINDWMSVSKDYTTNGHGKQYTLKLSKEQKLADGDYRIYAVGYSKNSDYTQVDKWVKATIDDFKFFESELAKGMGEEIFAGEIANISIKDGSFVLTENLKANVLTLHRQVAGNMGYFTEIPTFKRGGSNLLDYVTEGQDEYNEKNLPTYKELVASYELRLVSSDKNDYILLEQFNTPFTETGKDVRYVVNGTKSTVYGPETNFVVEQTDGSWKPTATKDAYNVYSIQLKDWFVNGDINLDGVLGEGDAVGDNWVTPSHMKGAGFKPGSVFAGEFIIPFTKVNDKNTLQLQLVGKKWFEGEGKLLQVSQETEVLRAWNINLPANDPQVGTEGDRLHVEVVDPNTGELVVPDNKDEEKFNSYSMVRNHMYAVGEKGSDKYDPETDKPEPLDKGQTLELKVNDNWELIHQMEVE